MQLVKQRWVAWQEDTDRKKKAETWKQKQAAPESFLFLFSFQKKWLLFHNLNLYHGRLHTLLLNLDDTWTHT